MASPSLMKNATNTCRQHIYQQLEVITISVSGKSNIAPYLQSLTHSLHTVYTQSTHSFTHSLTHSRTRSMKRSIHASPSCLVTTRPSSSNTWLGRGRLKKCENSPISPRLWTSVQGDETVQCSVVLSTRQRSRVQCTCSGVHV